MNDNKWTIYIKSIRLASRYSLRAAAKQLNVSAPYLHDVETGNRAPTKKLVNSIINLYNLDNEEKRIIFDAAAEGQSADSAGSPAERRETVWRGGQTHTGVADQG